MVPAPSSGGARRYAHNPSAAIAWVLPPVRLGAGRAGRAVGLLRLGGGAASPRGAAHRCRARVRRLPRRGLARAGASGIRVRDVPWGPRCNGGAEPEGVAEPSQVPQGRCGMPDVSSRAPPLDRLVRAMSHVRPSGPLERPNEAHGHRHKALRWPPLSGRIRMERTRHQATREALAPRRGRHLEALVTRDRLVWLARHCRAMCRSCSPCF